MTEGKRWIGASVRDVREIAKDVFQLQIVPEGGPEPYPSGSHIDVSVLINEAQATRSYSLIGPAPTDGAYRIAVKRLDNGRGGSIYMAGLKPGAQLTITRPTSHFELDYGSHEYLLVAGGIGITPIVGMAQALEQRGAAFRLLYAGRSRAAMPFVDELQDRLGTTLELFISGEGRRLDLAAVFRSLDEKAELYICGPASMRDAARSIWGGLGRDDIRFRFETFGSGGHRPSVPFSVVVDELGSKVAVPTNKSMLDVLRDAGVEMMWECLCGECGLCAVPVIGADTAIDHRDVFLSPDERAAGKVICTCVSRAAGGTITISSGLRRSFLATRPG